ncbi:MULTISPECIES: kinase [unclassified Sphingomonas]|uniref:kinase n=1 Tax=unclassified Sphingomonas TaxID=196159 RepID=UPI0006F78CF2|nr:MULTISPECIES: kinase [unclassified Sphingomonas]KQX23606.1 kinase [Sphingomonas sp. Root1294]KQY68453.1 kinase [Sphingomonas sp. Root50]KRB91409.1 kinase [Sphingomonas sp. Root720]
MAGASRRPFVLGICGAQGSGKSTLSNALSAWMREKGVPTAVLSIDDLYRTRAERERMAREIHPLFGVRGVPGTHDVGLGLDIVAALTVGREAALPRFDKARDDRAPADAWEIAPADTALLILEGWCVGARPEEDGALVEPVNELERVEDGEGRWRRAVNRALAGDYQALFARLDMLVLLAAPGFEAVRDWRVEQEHGLARSAGADASGVMSDAQVERFIRFYERLTRHILSEMPGRADLVVRLAKDRTPLSITVPAAHSR